MFCARTVAALAAWYILTLTGCGMAPRLKGTSETAVVAFTAGGVRGIDHPRFSRATAYRGLWVADAARDVDTWGIYFLEPYDPNRIPVLFVHGIGGTPLDFLTMLDALDRTKFQAWVFHYPTALRLGESSFALRGLLADLERKHRFGALVVVAHSMGGLVARGYLNGAQPDSDAVSRRLLITISSPWQGQAWAQSGARFMPGGPQSWIDLSPESDFLVSVRVPLRQVPQYVFFGFRSGASLLATGSSDGRISLASQMPTWIQDQAARCWGYDADHTGILAHPAALAQFKVLLASEAGRLNAHGVPAAYSR